MQTQNSKSDFNDPFKKTTHHFDTADMHFYNAKVTRLTWYKKQTHTNRK